MARGLMPESFVVLWRSTVRGRWQVQPFTYAEAAAEIVAARLIDQFGGESWIAPVEIPPRGEVPRELEGEG